MRPFAALFALVICFLGVLLSAFRSPGAISYYSGIHDEALIHTLLNISDTAAFLTLLFCLAVAVSRWRGFGIGLLVVATTCLVTSLSLKQGVLMLFVTPAVAVGLVAALRRATVR